MTESSPSPSAKTAELTCTTGGHNKRYVASLAPSPDGAGWLLLCQSGPIGGTQKRQDKITTPVPYEVAEKEYRKLIKKKLSNGYVLLDDAGAVVSAEASGAPEFTGLLPQLLNTVTDAELEPLLASDDWWLQQKHDGERLMIRHEPGKPACGINKKGQVRPLPAALRASIERLPHGCVLDGEIIGEHYFVFDVRGLEGAFLTYLDVASPIAKQPYETRELALFAAVEPALQDGTITLVQSFKEARSKRLRLAVLRESGAEGVVLRRKDAPYTENRPASGGDALKWKFTESATVRIKAVNTGKRSVAVELLDGETWCDVGNVTIPPNAAVPAVGALAEIAYLYVASRGGSLYQPQFKGVRLDQDESDCGIGQLKYKNEGRAAA